MDEAEGETSDARGSGSVFLDGYGKAKVKVSGEGVVEV